MTITGAFVSDLATNFKEIRKEIRLGRKSLVLTVQSPQDFDPEIYPVKVRHLIRRKNKPEEILHTIYAQTALLESRLHMTSDMYGALDFAVDAPSVGSRMRKSRSKLRRIMCKLYDFMLTIGVRRIKKKLCKISRTLKVNDETKNMNHIISILSHVENGTSDVIDKLDQLTRETEKCQLTGCDRNKRALVCLKHSHKAKNRTRTLSGRSGRRSKKSRRTKKKGSRSRDRKCRRRRKGGKCRRRNSRRHSRESRRRNSLSNETQRY